VTPAGIFVAVAFACLMWYLYRSGYEDGRKFELEREARRLDAESKRLDEERTRLEAQSKRRAADDEGPGTYGGPYNRHPKYPPGRDSK
jgi:hypothetical protein